MKILVPNLSDCELMFRNSLNMGWRDTLYLSLLVHPQTQSQRQDVIIIPTVSFFSEILFSPPRPPPNPVHPIGLSPFRSSGLWSDLSFYWGSKPGLPSLWASGFCHMAQKQMPASELHLFLRFPLHSCLWLRGVSGMHLKFFLNSSWACLVFWSGELFLTLSSPWC